MTEELPGPDGILRGPAETLPDTSQIAAEYGSIGDMRNDLVRNAHLPTLEAKGEAWAAVHARFKDLPGAIESDLAETLSEWEGDDAEQLRERVGNLVAFGAELAQGLERVAREIFPWAHQALKDAEYHAPYPNVCPAGEIPLHGAGSRSLSTREEMNLFLVRKGEAPGRELDFEEWLEFDEWNSNVRYKEEREAMIQALAQASEAMETAVRNWPAPPEAPGPLPGEDETSFPEHSVPDNPEGLPGGHGSGNGGSGTGTGGGGGTTPPETPQPGGSGGTGTGVPDRIDPDDISTRPLDPEVIEDFRDGRIPVMNLPNDDVALHPWLISTIPGDEWERMVRSMPPELWKKLAAENPHAIPPELAEHAPEHLVNSFPCNAPGWEPPLGPDGRPKPFAVFNPELAEHMSPDMERAIEDYETAEGKKAWEARNSEEGTGSGGQPSKDVTTRSWYAEVKAKREDREWGR